MSGRNSWAASSRFECIGWVFASLLPSSRPPPSPLVLELSVVPVRQSTLFLASSVVLLVLASARVEISLGLRASLASAASALHNFTCASSFSLRPLSTEIHCAHG